MTPQRQVVRIIADTAAALLLLISSVVIAQSGEPRPDAPVVQQGTQSSRPAVASTRSAEAPFGVEATPASGLPPLNVTFRILQYTEDGPVRVELDYEGNGAIDRDVATDELEFGYFYSQTGTFRPMVFVTSADGRRHSLSATIVIESAAQIDAKIRGVWNDFRAALVAEDTSAAASYFSEVARTRYAALFNQEPDELAALGAGLPELQQVTIMAKYAEYSAVREIDGVARLFLVQFVRDPDGIWRIAGM